MREILRRSRLAWRALATGNVDETHYHFAPGAVVVQGTVPDDLFDLVADECLRRAVATTGSTRRAWEVIN